MTGRRFGFVAYVWTCLCGGTRLGPHPAILAAKCYHCHAEFDGRPA